MATTTWQPRYGNPCRPACTPTSLRAMWADALFELERGHLLRLQWWAGASIAIGVLLLAFLAWRREHAPLLRHFAIQTLLWGAINMALALYAVRDLGLRDYPGAQQLVNFLWLNIGLSVGYVLVGVTLALTCWRLGPRMAGVGAGVGIMVQGCALFALDARLVSLIGPLG